jgi:hypothetical protein
MRSLSALLFAVFLTLLAAPSARAGEVTATVSNGTLTLTSDDLGVDFNLTVPAMALSQRTPRGGGGGGGISLFVVPNDGTTVNTMATPQQFDNVENVKATLGDGLNITVILGVAIPGSVNWKGGAGSDSLTFQATTVGDKVKIDLGEGANGLVVDADSTLQDTVTVKLGGGADTVQHNGTATDDMKITLGNGANTVLGDGSVNGKLVVKGGSGADLFDVAGLGVQQDAKISLGLGANSVFLGAGTQIGENLVVKVKSGADQVETNATQIGENLTLKLSSGNNSVILTDSQIGNNLTVKAGSGDDIVQLMGTTAIGGTQKYQTGGGTDVHP